MPKKPSDSGLVQAGQIQLWLPDGFDSKKKTTLEKAAIPQTKAQEKLIDAAVMIRQNAADAEDAAYIARELVQCTLPHSDPGPVPFWARKNGNLTLSIVSGFDPKTVGLVGYPFGSIPRLILFWVTTEALRTGSKRLYLGSTYNTFLREIGFDPNTGGGKRGDGKRVREQTRRLFAASISFIQTLDANGFDGERRLNMGVAAASELWWDPKNPDQHTIWNSWVELGEKFYEAITTAPVPVDIRALRALKRSPLALDLYTWATHKALSVARKGKVQFVPWQGLLQQFGADYTGADAVKNFKTEAKAALTKIQGVYPGLKLESATGGINILPSSRPAIPYRPPARSLST